MLSDADRRIDSSRNLLFPATKYRYLGQCAMHCIVALPPTSVVGDLGRSIKLHLASTDTRCARVETTRRQTRITLAIVADHGAHMYHAECHWVGSTGAGYEAYSRSHDVAAGQSDVRLQLSADASFRGDPRMLNPEELLLLAAASCQLLSFLAVAARARIDVVRYDDSAEAVMSESSSPMHLTRIVLHPRIYVTDGTTEERVRHLVEVAHRECYIANSLRTEILIEPKVLFE